MPPQRQLLYLVEPLLVAKKKGSLVEIEILINTIFLLAGRGNLVI